MRLSKVLDSIVSADPSLQFGLHHRLLNLSELARFLEPVLRARIGNVSSSTIVMALSRYQRALPAKMRRREAALRFKGMKRQKSLVLLTIPKSPSNIRRTQDVVRVLHATGGYLNMTEGDGQYALVTREDRVPLIEQNLPRPVLAEMIKVEAIILTFDRGYLPRPGILYLILQQLALQNISVIEIASTATEFILFLSPLDVELAERTLLKRFKKGIGR